MQRAFPMGKEDQHNEGETRVVGTLTIALRHVQMIPQWMNLTPEVHLVMGVYQVRIYAMD